MKGFRCIPNVSRCIYERLALCPETRRPAHLIPSNSAQTRFFVSSPQHSLRLSLIHNSSKTNRNSASIAATSAGEAKELSRTENLLKERYLYVQTSVDIWEDVPGGIFFDTAYLDSAPDQAINPAVPTVVSLHSSPGSFYDMQPVLEALIKTGCRVLAPSFPGHGQTEGITEGYDNIFTHTTVEKAEFVRDFLISIGVKKVDLLIGQGSGCYPAMRLVSGKDTSDMFKSAAFVSPWPHKHFKGTKQKNLLPLLHDMWDHTFYRPIARALSRFVPNTANTTSDERITMVRTLWNLNFSEIGGFAVSMGIQNFPMVVMFAEDNPFVDAEHIYELLGLMGITSDSIQRFNGLLERGQMEKFPSCLVMEKGGQHLEQTHPGVMSVVLFNLLKSVRPSFKAI